MTTRRLAALRTEWKAWRRADIAYLSHVDYCLLPCRDRCGHCEGCCSAAYRADRMAETEAEAKEITKGPSR